MPGGDPKRPWRHLYGTRWVRESKRFLDKNPLCARHRQRGEIVAATVVHHMIAHKGNVALFWNKANWEQLCKSCHDKWGQICDNAPTQCGPDGYPIDESW